MRNVAWRAREAWGVAFGVAVVDAWADWAVTVSARWRAVWRMPLILSWVDGRRTRGADGLRLRSPPKLKPEDVAAADVDVWPRRGEAGPGEDEVETAAENDV